MPIRRTRRHRSVAYCRPGAQAGGRRVDAGRAHPNGRQAVGNAHGQISWWPKGQLGLGLSSAHRAQAGFCYAFGQQMPAESVM